jgi:hypothetical protein
MTKAAEKLARWMHGEFLKWATKNPEHGYKTSSWVDMREMEKKSYLHIAEILLSEQADKLLRRKRK